MSSNSSNVWATAAHLHNWFHSLIHHSFIPDHHWSGVWKRLVFVTFTRWRCTKLFLADNYNCKLV